MLSGSWATLYINYPLLIYCLILLQVYDVVNIQSLDFITLKSHKYILQLNNGTASNPNRRHLQNLARGNLMKAYQLRYQPKHVVPRFYRPHFKPQRQSDMETTTTPITTTTTIVTEVDEETTVSATATELPEATSTEAIPTVTPTVMESTMTGITDATETTTMPALNNMMTTAGPTIMKPTIRFPWNLVEKFKNFLALHPAAELHLYRQQPGHNNKSQSKSKGFLGLFQVIEFENTRCTVSMADIRTVNGICYHDFECKNMAGIPTQRCAEGAGVCCIFVTSCGEVTNQAIVYFESPNYPQPIQDMQICSLVIKLRKNVKQLRLDFIKFELNRPTEGDCIDDQFLVSGHNVNFPVPILCGINTGQHNVEDSLERKIFLTFLGKVATGSRVFNIKITQLTQDLTPPGCLQYFTEAEGVVKSFNYDRDGSFVNDPQASYLNNLNYVICLKRLKGMCSTVYMVANMNTISENAEQLEFQIINKDNDGNNLLPDGQAGAGIFNCPDDYLAINQVRLCGDRFNDGTDNGDFTVHTAIRDVTSGPILLPFHSDSINVGRGFRLLYKQELCL